MTKVYTIIEFLQIFFLPSLTFCLKDLDLDVAPINELKVIVYP